VACEECSDLRTHAFSSQTDLVHAFQVAAAEVDRGALVREPVKGYSIAEEEAVRSAHAAGAFPEALRYRFKCAVCGDTFELRADMESGDGSWSRNGEDPSATA
jgi:hypothetical protein